MIHALAILVADEVVFDGPITEPTAIFLGILLGFGICAMVWTERKIIGKRWAVLFAGLRLVALAAVCWMLLQPSLVQRSFKVQTRSIAILADRSGSMETVDAQVTSQMLPWLESRHAKTDAAECATIDLRFATTLIQKHVLHSATLGEQARSDLLDQIDHATARCDKHLATLISDSSKDDQVVADRASAIRDALIGTKTDREILGAGTDRSVISQHADRMVETFQQQAAELDSIVVKLHRDRTENPESYTPQSRREHVQQWLSRLEQGKLKELPKSVKITRAIFDSAIHPFSGDDWSNQLRPAKFESTREKESARTDLAAAVSWLGPTAVRDRLAGVLLITEGGHNAENELSPVAAGRMLGDVPILGVGIGNAMRSRDLVLHRVNVPRIVSEDDDVKIEAIISAYDCESTATEVVLTQGPKEIERRVVRFSSSMSDTRLQFRVPAQSIGIREYQLSIDPIDGEVSEKNNYSAFAVETVRGNTRVLLADYQPRWEYRYLQILFARDDRVEADEFLELPSRHATGQVAASGRLPESVDEWAHYDVVILGDLPLNRASRESLREYVRQRAGKLIVIAGKNHMPSAYVSDPFFDLLPIQPKQATDVMLDPVIAITPEGVMHPAIQIDSTPQASRDRWQMASSRAMIGFLSPWTTPRDSARVLANLRSSTDASADDLNADSSAWLCWHRVGSGHVVYLSSPSVHKLRFRGGDTYHHRFWGQMLRWLMASDLASEKQLVHLRTDKSNYIQGDSVQVVVQIKTPDGFPYAGGEVSLNLSAVGGARQTVALVEAANLPGTYRAEIRDLEPEVYKLTPSGAFVETLQENHPESQPAQTLITVEQIGDVEHMLTSANYPLIAEIAAASGGHLLTPAAAEEVLSLLPLKEEVETIEKRNPIWNRWHFVWLIVGCLSTEWIFRKMKGLV